MLALTQRGKGAVPDGSELKTPPLPHAATVSLQEAHPTGHNFASRDPAAEPIEARYIVASKDHHFHFSIVSLQRDSRRCVRKLRPFL
jgi:hypothetical protein